MDKNLFLFMANIFQVVVSCLIGKLLHGRRVQVIYFIVGLTACIEIFFSYYAFRGGKNEPQQIIFYIKATLVYILYYMVCQFGVVDIAKVEALQTNSRLCGSLLCAVIASQQIILALILERYIFEIIPNFWTNALVDQIANLATAFFLYEMLQQEQDEVKLIRNVQAGFTKEFMKSNRRHVAGPSTLGWNPKGGRPVKLKKGFGGMSSSGAMTAGGGAEAAEPNSAAKT